MAVFAGVTESWMIEEPEGRKHVSTKLLIQEGLIANYDFGSLYSEQTTLSSLTNDSNSIQLYNGPVLDFQENGAVYFDGTNDFAKTDTVNNFRMICIFAQKKNDTGLTSWRYLVDARPGHPSGYIAALGIGTWDFYLNGGDLVTTSWSNIPTDEWFYLCADAKQNYTSTINFMSRTSNNEVLPGKISNIQIYDRTLTQNEMEHNFTFLRSRYGV